MRLFNNINNYIGENNFKIIISNNKIDIINYKLIKEINSNKIIIDNYVFEGKNLEPIKLFSNEILINGEINKIYINE